jgi:hypothetical protein
VRPDVVYLTALRFVEVFGVNRSQAGQRVARLFVDHWRQRVISVLHKAKQAPGPHESALGSDDATPDVEPPRVFGDCRHQHVGLRAVLRKATTVFHKLPGTGMYGLTSWYPDARAARATDDDGDARPSKAKLARAKAVKKAARSRPGKATAAKAASSADADTIAEEK